MTADMYHDGRYLENNETWHEEDSPYKTSFVLKIIQENQLNPKSIADIGCGSGLVAELIAKAYPEAKVVGYDISPDASSFWSKRRAPNLSFKLEDYGSSDADYELATCLDVFEHVDDYLGFLRTIRPHSKYVVFNIPLDMSVMKLVTPGIRRARTVSGHLHYFNIYTARETLKDCGYEIVDSFVSSPLFSTLPRNIFQWLLVLPRMGLSLVNKRMAATLLGGHSLVVLAKS
jgi:SAM-dependent methyltransferase